MAAGGGAGAVSIASEPPLFSVNVTCRRAIADLRDMTCFTACARCEHEGTGRAGAARCAGAGATPVAVEKPMSETEDLCSAIEAGDIGRARRLLTSRPGLVNSTEGTPPPLHWAIYQDRPRAVELLLDHGADLELRDRDRDATPLDYAIVYARTEIIRVLVSKGASLDGGMRLAVKGASGGFEAFDELPSRRRYEEVVGLLRELGAGR